MGGVEDDEPPSKRVKVSPGEVKNLSDRLSLTGSASSCLEHSMARPLCLEGGEEMVGSKQLIKKVEFVRVITKALYSLGFNKSGALLEEESGIQLHSSAVTLFRQHVLDGNWDESVATLHKIGLLDESTLRSAAFLILEQKFLEHLGKDEVMEALKTLRNEIAPLSTNESRLHELSSCIVSPSWCKVLGVSSQDILGSDSRIKLLDKVQKLLPPSVLMPERRLEHLVEQALSVQRKTCHFHNTLDGAMSLYTDHHCGMDQIPSKTLQVLQAHRDEVWFLQFSHNGKYLASSSNDGSTIVWEVNEEEVSLKHTLTGHKKPVLAISWSPDDSQILTCGVEEAIRCWDVTSGECLHVYEKAGIGMVSCGWSPDGKRLFSGLSDKSICMWDRDGKELKCWKGHRTTKISDMAVTSDGKRIISICRETAILLFDWETRLDRQIEEDQTITSFSLSRDDNYLLVNLVNQEIHLWCIEGDPKLTAKYKGHKRTRFVVRSCFGGSQQAFIASGSEDSQVYIWHRETGELLETLSGHSGLVNCVSWNPVNPHMLASASDDRTIRIWGLNRVNMKRKETLSNGCVHRCNGGS